MGSRHIARLSFILFLFSVSSVCTGDEALTLNLSRTVFVALAGENLDIGYTLKLPANQSSSDLSCSSPSEELVYVTAIEATGDGPEVKRSRVLLRNLSESGLYTCRYQSAQVFWYLQVRDEGYRKIREPEPAENLAAVVVTALLLVGNVLASVYVFRGRGGSAQKETNTESGRTETGEEAMNVAEAQSSSFYASLEPRPRSIYEVLERPAAGPEKNQTKAKSSSAHIPAAAAQTAEAQKEGIFESVYENF